MSQHLSAAAIRARLEEEGVPLLPVEDNAKLPMTWLLMPMGTETETCTALRMALEMKVGVNPTFAADTRYRCKLALADATDRGQQYRVVLILKPDA